MSSRLNIEQAKQVGRIRDALHTLGYPVPHGRFKAPGTLADLAAMAPSMGKFSARAGADFVQRIRNESDSTKRAEMMVTAVEAAVHAGRRIVPVEDLLKAVGKGFLAFHANKNPRARVATVMGVLNQITAATSR